MSSCVEDVESGYAVATIGTGVGTSYKNIPNSQSYNNYCNCINVNNNKDQELTLWSRLSRVIYSMFDKSTYQPAIYQPNSSILPKYVCSSDNNV